MAGGRAGWNGSCDPPIVVPTGILYGVFRIHMPNKGFRNGSALSGTGKFMCNQSVGLHLIINGFTAARYLADLQIYVSVSILPQPMCTTSITSH